MASTGGIIDVEELNHHPNGLLVVTGRSVAHQTNGLWVVGHTNGILVVVSVVTVVCSVGGLGGPGSMSGGAGGYTSKRSLVESQNNPSESFTKRFHDYYIFNVNKFFSIKV